MDAKQLAEIKARGEAAAVHEYDGITDLIYGRDVKALVAEVERLKAESEEWRNAYIRMKEDWKHDCDLLVQAGTENATLKQALKIAIRRAYPHASPDTVKAAAACLIEEAREQEATTC